MITPCPHRGGAEPQTQGPGVGADPGAVVTGASCCRTEPSGPVSRAPDSAARFVLVQGETGAWLSGDGPVPSGGLAAGSCRHRLRWGEVAGLRACVTGVQTRLYMVLWGGVHLRKLARKDPRADPRAGPAWPTSSPFPSRGASRACDGGSRCPHRPPPCGRPSSPSVGSRRAFHDTRR